MIGLINTDSTRMATSVPKKDPPGFGQRVLLLQWFALTMLLPVICIRTELGKEHVKYNLLFVTTKTPPPSFLNFVPLSSLPAG